MDYLRPTNKHNISINDIPINEGKYYAIKDFNKDLCEFTTSEYIHRYYDTCIHLIEIELVTDNIEFKLFNLKHTKIERKMVDDIVHINLIDTKFTTNKYIVKKKYSLFDLKTYDDLKLNIEDNDYIIEHACRLNNINFLNKNYRLNYSHRAIDMASANGHVNVLDWWKNNKLYMSYSILAIDLASSNGHIEVLEWWKNSGLELKYTRDAIDNASEKCLYEVLEWWKKSGLKIFHGNRTMNYATRDNDIKMLEWWKESGLECMYDRNIMTIALRSNDIKTIEWWINSGLQLNFDKVSFEYCSIEVIKWYKQSGLPKVIEDKQKIQDWWNNSCTSLRLKREFAIMI
jgi:hypothetical protein